MIPLIVKVAAGLGVAYLLSQSHATPKTLDALHTLASQLDAELRAKGPAYDREMLKAFQRATGIAVDGLYGPESKHALEQVTGREAPAPIFLAAQDQPSHEPLTLTEAQQAKEAAERVDANLRATGSNYDRELMKAFQRLARPLYPDGKYGPATAGALLYYLDRQPPAPIYTGRDGSKTLVPYQPPK